MLEELIKIEDGRVSARELHKKLKIIERFNQWFERQLRYGFEENKDYIGCEVFNTLARQNLQDYSITISMAKEISMIQRNELGKRFRQYFIECEEYIKKTQEEQFNQWRESNEEEKLLLESRLSHTIQHIENICGGWRQPGDILLDNIIIPKQFVLDTMFRLWIDKNDNIKSGAFNKVTKNVAGVWFISDRAIKCLKVNWINSKDEDKAKYSLIQEVF